MKFYICNSKKTKTVSLIGTFILIYLIIALAGINLSIAEATNQSGSEQPFMIKVYYSEDCEHCEAIRVEFLPPLLKKYKGKVRYSEYNVVEPEHMKEITKIEDSTGIPNEKRTWPALIFNTVLLEGEDEIKKYLPGLLSGKIKPDDMQYIFEREKTVTEDHEKTARGTAMIHAAYFNKPGCSECDRVETYLRYLESEFSGLRISKFNINDKRSTLINEYLSQKAGIPEEKHLATPSIFIGEGCLVGESSLRELTNLIAEYEDEGAPAFWEDLSDEELERAGKTISNRMKTWGPLTVAFAGLIDGVNPCAFATIIFFISYLGFLGRSKRDIIIVGTGFTISVFLTYFFVGLGFFKFLEHLSETFNVVKVMIFIGTAVLAVIFGVLSLYDFIRIRKGKASDMVLQLPGFLKKRIHKTIREKSRMKGILAGAIIAGFIVSILELACTGQVYLPTITYMLSTETMRPRALLFLIMYNIMFIVPLVFVFVIVFFGVSSKQIAGFFQSNVAKVKLLTSLLFFGIAVLLILSVV